MLADLYTLQWYGPAAAATWGDDNAGTVSAGIKGFGRHNGTITNAGIVSNADMTSLKNSPATITATGIVNQALPKGSTKFACTVKVNALSQDDVTGAVLESFVEGDLTLKQAMRLMLARLTGNATGLDGTSIAFKSLDGTKTRVGGTVISGTRTITTRDGG